ncbi:hypothetical protein ACLB2K_046005 [Fragaria x ananassa]
MIKEEEEKIAHLSLCVKTPNLQVYCNFRRVSEPKKKKKKKKKKRKTYNHSLQVYRVSGGGGPEASRRYQGGPEEVGKKEIMVEPWRTGREWRQSRGGEEG